MKTHLRRKYEIFNICSSRPIYLKNFIKITEKYAKKINIQNVPAHPADVYKTHGSNQKLLKQIKYKRFTDLETAIKNTIFSYKKYKIFNQNN